MSYNPTTWKSGDKVTSNKLNKIEQAIVNIDDELADVMEDLNSEIGDLSSLTTTDKSSAVSAVNELADVVYTSEDTEVPYKNLFTEASEIMMLSIGTTSFSQGSSLYGFYVPVTALQGEEILIRRTNMGNRFRGVFTINPPAVDVTYSSDDRFVDDGSRNKLLIVPDYANYLYVAFYSSTLDTLTQEELLDGMTITKMNQVNLYNQALAEVNLIASRGQLVASNTHHGFYIPIDYRKGNRIIIQRTNSGKSFGGVLSENVPTVGVAYDELTIKNISYLFILNLNPNDKYLYVWFYDSETDILTKSELLEGMKVRYLTAETHIVKNDNVSRIAKVYDALASEYSTTQVYAVGDYCIYEGDLYKCATAVSTAEAFDKDKWEKVSITDEIDPVIPVDKTLQVENAPADSASVGKQIFSEYEDNLYDYSIGELRYTLDDGQFGNEDDSLHGFYIPVDPSIDTRITVIRGRQGTRLRVVATTDVPAVGVSYYRMVSRDTSSNLIYYLEPTDKYIYVAYYNEETDTLTEQELLAGMTIHYGVHYEPQESRISRLDFAKHSAFANGYADSKGDVIADSKHIISTPIRMTGRFGVSCSANYVVTLFEYDFDGNFLYTRTVTNRMSYLYHYGYVRFAIGNSDESDISFDDVDFTQVKMTANRYSASEYTREKTFVLDAENCDCNEVYEYIDEAVETHGMYATKTYLCTESSGRPIYYYTLGNGAKKIMLICGQHGHGSGGDPRDSVITVAKMMRDLINSDFADNSFLKKLHDEYTILVIPILNAYGFDEFSRTNADGVDINRDWTSPATIEVTAAKSLMTTFNPSIALDIHCNGTTPYSNANVKIQFGLGATHNPLYSSSVRDSFMSYYDTDVETRVPNSEDTLQYYIINTLGILGGLLELRWWTKAGKWMHDSQASSADYNMVLNVLKYLASVEDSETYVYEHTPNQNQY